MIRRTFPPLVRSTLDREEEPPTTKRHGLGSDAVSRIAFHIGKNWPEQDPFWSATRLSAIEIARLGLFVLADRECCMGLDAFDGCRLFVAWDGDLATAPRAPGLALELQPSPNPILEAEGARRAVSWAPRRFIEAGWDRCPEFLLWGDLKALRAFPRGLADIVLLPADGALEPEDFYIGRSTAIACPRPPAGRPLWAGTTVVVGPELLWREPFMEDPRARIRI